MDKIAFNIGTAFGSPIGQGDVGVAKLISIILSNALVVAGILMLFLMIGGGIGVIAGAGQGSPESAAKGRQAVTAAVIGFIIIFAAYWIIQIIETVTGLSILDPGL
jgi:Zn-dependent protease with chaperone function